VIILSHITETFNASILDKMKKFYQDNQLSPTPQGAIFRAKTEDATITAYRSGKVLFQGKNPDVEARIWQEFRGDSPAKVAKGRNSQENKDLSFLTGNHIGSDESGTGDYFGPVTSCAVYVQKDQMQQLKDMGIQDSKAIPDDKIKVLSKQLVQMGIPYSLMVLKNEKYNSLQKKGWSQGKMKAMLHHSTIDQLQRKLGFPAEAIVIDQFCLPAVYNNYLKSEDLKLHPHTHFLTKAETHSIAVAAASVIARASFLKEMDALSQDAGFNLLKGASQKVDQLAAKMIKAKGEASLNTFAKVHFANTNKAKKYL